MTFSIYDLEILTDAVAFAALVTIGGVVVWLMGRRLSRGNRTDARLALASAALIAVGAAGVAIRSTVGDAVPVAATIAAPVDGRAEARQSFRPQERTFAPDDGSSSRPDGSARTAETADPVSADDGASAGSHADDPGSGSGSDSVAGPPSVGVEGPDEPQDDPPQQPPDDPPEEDPTDAPDPDTDGDTDDGGEEPSGQGPDGQGPPGHGEGGPQGQGPDGQGPPGHSGDS
jgi:hypothetical protein